MLSKNSIIAQCTLYGLEIKTYNDKHFKVLGGILPVNVYKSKPGFVMHIEGTSKGKIVKNATEVAEAAVSLPKPGQLRKTARSKHKSVKNRKWVTSKNCHWCGVKFTDISECTADHIIPISLGGSNGEHNIVLSCLECNCKRGDTLTARDILTVNHWKKWHEKYKLNEHDFLEFLKFFISKYYVDGKLSEFANLELLRNKIRLFGYDSSVAESDILGLLNNAKRFFERTNIQNMCADNV